MLIGWATPFNIRSAIGKFSRFVGEELSSRGYDVAFIRIESGPELELPALETELPILSAESANLEALDHLVVNFGNHAPYHAQSVSLLARRAPLAIFHDAEMRDFEWGLRNRHGVDVPRLHGSGAVDPRGSDIVAPAARSLLGTLAAMSWGAIVHGPHYRETVERYCPGPVEVIPLCYPDDTATALRQAPSEGRRVIIFGVITEHKQPRRVMRAIARLRGRLGPIELHLAGAVEEQYRTALLEQATELGIDPPLFHGYVSDERLRSLIEDSQAICCLRYPVTEGGSASLVTSLYRQRPLIISDIASYSQVPDELAFKVSYGEEVGDLEQALLEVFRNPKLAEDKASKARQWASDRYSAASYVDALLPLLDDQSPLTMAQLARNLVEPLSATDHRPMISALPDFAEAMDWMLASQVGSRIQ